MNTYHTRSLEIQNNTRENNKDIPTIEKGIHSKNTKMITISRDQDEIVIVFTEGIDCLLTLLPDTHFLLSGEGSYANRVLRINRETFETYLFKKKTLPILLTNDSIGNMKRIELALNQALGSLQRRLGKLCRQIEQTEEPVKQNLLYDQLREKALAVLMKVTTELAMQEVLDVKEFIRNNTMGFYQDNYPGMG